MTDPKHKKPENVRGHVESDRKSKRPTENEGLNQPMKIRKERRKSPCASAINSLTTFLDTNKYPGNKSSSVQSFKNKLECLLESIQRSEEIQKMYTYERDLYEKLENDVQELSFFLTEVKAMCTRITQLKRHRGDVRKEIRKVKKVYLTSKQQEMHEMELVVAVYDKDLLRKWHMAKKSTQATNLEAFLGEVMGKKQAVEYVRRMTEERLNSLKAGKGGLKAEHSAPPLVAVSKADAPKLSNATRQPPLL